MRINNAENTRSGGTGAVFMTIDTTEDKTPCSWLLPKQCWLLASGHRAAEGILATLTSSGWVESIPCPFTSSAGLKSLNYSKSHWVTKEVFHELSRHGTFGIVP